MELRDVCYVHVPYELHTMGWSMNKGLVLNQMKEIEVKIKNKVRRFLYESIRFKVVNGGGGVGNAEGWEVVTPLSPFLGDMFLLDPIDHFNPGHPALEVVRLSCSDTSHARGTCGSGSTEIPTSGSRAGGSKSVPAICCYPSFNL